MAASDFNTAPWFSPAGPRRGQYVGITSLSYSPNKTERDSLYKAGINPISNISPISDFNIFLICTIKTNCETT
mgnify:CR=1 FL=1